MTRLQFGVLIGSVLFVTGVAFLFLRRSGVSQEALIQMEENRLASRLGFPGMLQSVFGKRVTCRSADGRVLWTELYRGSKIPIGNGPCQPMTIPFVSGNYYDTDGVPLSSVRDGTGVRVMFYTNGNPDEVEVVKDGRPRLSVRFHANGAILDSHLFDGQGLLHGPCTSYCSNGIPRETRVYHHGRCLPRGERVGAHLHERESGGASAHCTNSISSVTND